MYNDYGLTQTQPTLDSTVGTIAGVAIAVIIIAVIIGLAIAIFLLIAKCKMFSKAGESWWKAIIPLYDRWVIGKVGGLAWWWFPIFVVLTGLTTKITIGTEVGNSVYTTASVWAWALVLVEFNYYYNLCKKFGKSGGFAFLCTILPIIGIPMLAFGSAKYDKSVQVDKNGVFSIEK
jgi:hypothetical protein